MTPQEHRALIDAVRPALYSYERARQELAEADAAKETAANAMTTASAYLAATMKGALLRDVVNGSARYRLSEDHQKVIATYDNGSLLVVDLDNRPAPGENAKVIDLHQRENDV